MAIADKNFRVNFPHFVNLKIDKQSNLFLILWSEKKIPNPSFFSFIFNEGLLHCLIVKKYDSFFETVC